MINQVLKSKREKSGVFADEVKKRKECTVGKGKEAVTKKSSKREASVSKKFDARADGEIRGKKGFGYQSIQTL